MSVLVGKKAPNFKSTAVFNGEFKEISLSDFKGKYVILFFYPLDFTFVCPTELHAFQAKLAKFKELNCEILGCSIDSQFSHKAWLDMPKEKGGIKGVEYGLVSDIGGKIASLYDVLNDAGIAYRGLFLIDKEGNVKHQLVNDLPLGRSIDEAIRILEALIHFEKYGDVCPANWSKDKKAIKPTTESVSSYLANH
jgi:peroxiredoxin (alkyl hydroperoxide reductase subunit C)